MISITGDYDDTLFNPDDKFYAVFVDSSQRVALFASNTDNDLGALIQLSATATSFSFNQDGVDLTFQIINLEEIDFDFTNGSLADAFRFELTAGDVDYPLEAVMGKDLKGSTVSNIDVTNTESAEVTLRTVDLALEEVNAARAELGALNNRLESTINNLDQTKNNVAGAKSQIMDADFAAETAQLSKSQIIQRAGVSVLSQANSSQQAVLSLL